MEIYDYLPPIFVGHGGGPMPILGDIKHTDMIKNIKKLANSIPKPKEILIISAHWEENDFTILENPSADLLYDYYGFPEEAYNLNYPIKNATNLNKKLYELLQNHKIPYKISKDRDFDHGVFIPLMLMYPNLNVPVSQISLKSDLNPKEHIKLGEAISQLSNEGVLIMASGMSFHNISSFFSKPDNNILSQAKNFKNYLIDTFTKEKNQKAELITKSQRMELLVNWKQSDGWKLSHPREEHLVPLFVSAGASINGKGIIQEYNLMNFDIINIIFSEES